MCVCVCLIEDDWEQSHFNATATNESAAFPPATGEMSDRGRRLVHTLEEVEQGEQEVGKG